MNFYYGRGPYFLKKLMNEIGKDEFLSILAEYVKSYTFKIATTQGFLRILRDGTTVDIEGIIDEYITNIE